MSNFCVKVFRSFVSVTICQKNTFFRGYSSHFTPGRRLRAVGRSPKGGGGSSLSCKTEVTGWLFYIISVICNRKKGVAAERSLQLPSTDAHLVGPSTV